MNIQEDIEGINNQFKWIASEATKHPKNIKELRVRFWSEARKLELLLTSLGLTTEEIKKLAGYNES